MPRVDDYQLSYDLAAQELLAMDWTQVARRSGAEASADGQALMLDYYGRPLTVARAGGAVSVAHRDDGPALPLAEQALVLHYLARSDGTPPAGEWITFREVESGEFYWSAFVKRAKSPLVGFFGERPQLLKDLAPLVGGREGGGAGDASVIVRALPRVELLLVLWAGDEEFPADGNVLMDKHIGHYLNTEDVALAAGLPIYKMMALARR
ncbi:MAG: DUF3786 domain-containing protein [Thermodesulfobacteriota bacterium]